MARRKATPKRRHGDERTPRIVTAPRNTHLTSYEDTMCDITTRAERALERAKRIIADTRILDIWPSHGCRINTVGSVRTGLIMDHRDIDFHIYSTEFRLADSFAAIAELAENPRITRITYDNLLRTEEQCVEWHAWYRDDSGDDWQIDMIHILEESPFAGYFEKVADRISARLTPETKAAILAIKHALPLEEKVPSISVYRAVLEGGVRTEDAFRQWLAANPPRGIEEWMPE